MQSSRRSRQRSVTCLASRGSTQKSSSWQRSAWNKSASRRVNSSDSKKRGKRENILHCLPVNRRLPKRSNSGNVPQLHLKKRNRWASSHPKNGCTSMIKREIRIFNRNPGAPRAEMSNPTSRLPPIYQLLPPLRKALLLNSNGSQLPCYRLRRLRALF